VHPMFMPLVTTHTKGSHKPRVGSQEPSISLNFSGGTTYAPPPLPSGEEVVRLLLEGRGRGRQGGLILCTMMATPLRQNTGSPTISRSLDYRRTIRGIISTSRATLVGEATRGES